LGGQRFEGEFTTNMTDTKSGNTALEEPQVRPKNQTEAKTDDKKKPKKQPPYAVIVHDDDFHTYEYVIEVLQKVCGHDLQKAFLLTQAVDLTGRAVVWTGTKEVAELKRDQIRGFGPDFYAQQTVTFPLGVTIEPMPSSD
jgi:ATP-dependent Clp protease adaptor protein ClpS